VVQGRTREIEEELENEKWRSGVRVSRRPFRCIYGSRQALRRRHDGEVWPGCVGDGGVVFGHESLHDDCRRTRRRFGEALNSSATSGFIPIANGEVAGELLCPVDRGEEEEDDDLLFV
jgi:hypothetical protein